MRLCDRRIAEPAMDAPASLPYGRSCAGRLLCRQRPSFSEWQERDAIKDALEKEMNHYLSLLTNALIPAGRFDDLPVEVRGEEYRTLGHRLRTPGAMGSS